MDGIYVSFTGRSGFDGGIKVLEVLLSRLSQIWRMIFMQCVHP